MPASDGPSIVNDVVAALEAAEEPLLVTHRNADRDGLGAAIGLRELLGRGTVCAPGGVARPARSLLDATDTDPVSDPSTSRYDAVVVLDAASSDRIGPVDPAEPILVDHHEPGDLAARAGASLVDTDAGATAELVARLAAEADWEVATDAALPLLVGILDDTNFLSLASGRTVETAVDLLGDVGDRASELPRLTAHVERGGERNARIIGTLRASGYRAGDRFVAVTDVGAHEAAAARALRDAGVDLVAVCNEHVDGVRVTARAAESFTEDVDLAGELLPALAETFGGDSGGHAGAGVAHLDEGDREAVEQALISWLEAELGVTFGTVTE